MFLQLSPLIPVSVVDSGGRFPVGCGWAFGWLDYSEEHFVLWGVAFDGSGEVWWVDNRFVRFQGNRSLGRVVGV